MAETKQIALLERTEEDRKNEIFAKFAATRLSAHTDMQFTVEKTTAFSALDPKLSEYELVFHAHDQHDFRALINHLGSAGVQMKPWNWVNMPEGIFDLSRDPEFRNRRQKLFVVRFFMWDAHAGGF